jgi:hypothetical protein
VYTSDMKNAGTDADVTMDVSFRGTDGDTTVEHLEFAPQTTDDMFERGSVDHFTFDIADVGEPFKLQVSARVH